MNNYEKVNDLLHLLYKEQMKTNVNSKYRQAVDEAIGALNELKKYWQHQAYNRDTKGYRRPKNDSQA